MILLDRPGGRRLFCSGSRGNHRQQQKARPRQPPRRSPRQVQQPAHLPPRPRLPFLWFRRDRSPAAKPPQKSLRLTLAPLLYGDRCRARVKMRDRIPATRHQPRSLQSLRPRRRRLPGNVRLQAQRAPRQRLRRFRLRQPQWLLRRPASSASGNPGDGTDLAALAQRMLELVNADRTANGLQPVAWDETAALAGQQHSEEMAQFGYMSHWNMDGYGPEYRYSRAGGLDMSQENVYRLVHQWEDGRGAPIDDWEQVVADAAGSADEQPGAPGEHPDARAHAPGRRNRLQPGDRQRGDLPGVRQPLRDHRAAAAPGAAGRPHRAPRARCCPGSTDPLVNLAYEPFPGADDAGAAEQDGHVHAARQSITLCRRSGPMRTAVSSRSSRSTRMRAPGLYHVLVWVESSPVRRSRCMAVDAIIEVNRVGDNDSDERDRCRRPVDPRRLLLLSLASLLLGAWRLPPAQAGNAQRASRST